MPIEVELAGPADLASVHELLQECGLPRTGLCQGVGTLLLVVRDGGRVVGCGALELYGSSALLRSLAVAPAWRGRGVGRAVSERALELARRLEQTQVYLLTQTAEGFFARLGFRATARDAVPAPVARSVEFTSVCPASAVCMVKALDDSPMGAALDRGRR